VKQAAVAMALVAFAAAGGPPAKLAFTTAPVQVQAGTCSPRLTVQLQDDGGTPVAAAANLAVDLSGAPAFETACPGPPVAQVTIDAGTAATSFQVIGTTAGRFPVTASATGLAGATQDVEILPGAPGKIVMLDGPSPLNTGECATTRFQLQDVYGNASPPPPPGMSVGASSPDPDVRLFADRACSMPYQDQLVVAPASTGELSFLSTAPATFDLHVDVAGGLGLPSGTQTWTTSPVSADLELRLVEGEDTTGSRLGVQALAANTGPRPLSGPRLFLRTGGLELSDAGPYPIELAAAGASSEVDVSGTITGRLGSDVVVRGHLETSGGVALGPEVMVSRPVARMVADLGGCGCGSAGGADLAIAAAALALGLLRGSRRRSPGSG